MRLLVFFGFEVAEWRFFPWIRRFLSLTKDFCFGEGTFSLRRGFFLGERVFSLARGFFPRGEGFSSVKWGFFHKREEIFEGFFLGEGIFSP